MSRETKFQLPKQELYYWDTVESVYKPLVVNGALNVAWGGGNVLNGRLKNVTTAGTAVRLDSIECREVTVIARKNNTGSIFIGGSNVSGSMFGVELHANESFTFAVNNANLIYINSTVSGEGVSYVTV